MHHQRCVPRAEHPVYNMVMSDVTVSCTSLEKDRRVGVAVLSGLSSIYICTLNFSLYRGCFERPCIWCLWHVTESRWYCMSFFYLFNWRLITLQYCSGFCHTLTWISHGCTCVSHPEPPSHLPPHPMPQGHPSAPGLSTLSHASNLDW